MKNMTNRNKFFIVVTLALIVVGMAILGIFGLNGSVDYPSANNKGYEVQVSVNMNAGDSINVLKSSTEEYFKNKGLTPVNGATQTLAEGKQIIYKFNTDVTATVADLKTFIEGKLAAAGVSAVEVETEVYEVYAKSFNKVLGFAGVLLAVIAVVFVYSLIMEKLAGSLATAFAMALSAILALSMIALCRVPVGGIAGIGMVAATAIGGALAIATVSRYNEEKKANSTLTNAQVIEKVAKSEKGKYIALVVACALVAIALAIVGIPNGAFVGLQLLIGAVCGTFSAYLGSAFIWGAVKK